MQGAEEPWHQGLLLPGLRSGGGQPSGGQEDGQMLDNSVEVYRGGYGRGWRGERGGERAGGEAEEAAGVVAEVVQPLEQLTTLRLTSHSSPEYVRWAGGSGRQLGLYWSQGSGQQVQQLGCSRNWPCSPNRGRCSSWPQPYILREEEKIQ